ncbi:MAG: hypothetical protein KDB14_30745 [Planctomycetales bacterium]|nr:hypothetical protein [Planctomycetales bacterium]
MSEPSGPRDEQNHIETTELPSLPDGGLSANMPAWLRRAPSFVSAPVEPDTTQGQSVAIDWSELTRGLVLPEWLEHLSSRVESGVVLERAIEPGTIERMESLQLNDPNEARTEEASISLVAGRSTSRPEGSTNTHQVAIRSKPLPQEPSVEPPFRALAILVLLVVAALITAALLSIAS